MRLRVPEHREEARKDLAAIIDQPKMDNLVAHRALAWDLMEKKNYEQAVEELGDAITIDNKDPMTHYYLALYKYEEAKGAGGGEMKGLANMMQDLHVVLDLDHEFAEAYYMLGVAQTEGGGLRAATDSVRAAIELSPRRPDYLLELARIYEAGKHWDAATALLERLAGNSNSEVASGAKQDLHDLPYIKKYGIPPVADAASAGDQKSPADSGSSTPSSATQQSDAAAKQTATSDGGDDTSQQVPAAPQIDKRPIQYARGKLVAVDCSQAPAAVVTIATAAKTMKLRTADYKSLMLVGEDNFSCDWTNRSASVNYKAGGKMDGDLVSLEVH
jgi:tetratricopeptide (TPR) repeat protein